MQMSSNRWFAIHVRPNSEKMVAMLLRYKGYEEFLPLYEADSAPLGRRKAERPLFPGYVFCHFAESANGLIVTTPGVIRIVGAGAKSAPIDDAEIAALKMIGKSRCKVRPWPRLEEGEVVTIARGPLCGCRGVLKAWKDSNHFIVSVKLLQRSLAIQIRAEWLSPLARIEPQIAGASDSRSASALRAVAGRLG
jgi:transcription antitermination factor NusG